VPRRQALLLAGLSAVLAALVFSACGGDDDDDKVEGIQAVSANCGEVQYSGSGEASKLIVSDLPLQGDSAERSKQMNDAILQEIARKGWQAGPDIQLAFQECDDSIASTGEWDENTCRSNAQAYASNPDVIGVIGTYNSGCAAVMIPILNQAPGGGVAMVSPGNTLVCLTEPASICEPDEPEVYYPTGRRNYARVVPNDAVQGAGMASFAYQGGIRRPFVLIAADDPTSEGQGMTFANAGESLGMEIAGIQRFDPEAESYAGAMRMAKAAGADAVFLGTILELGGTQLIKDKVSVLGPNEGPVKLLAPDGFAQQATIDQAGPASLGMYVSLPGKVPEALRGDGAIFVGELSAQIGDQPIEVFAPYAGTAVEVLIDAIRVGKDRAGTIDALFEERPRQSITGAFTITPSGDPRPAPISVQRAGETFELERTIVPAPEQVTAAHGG
jgi:branched-chain amino acid transport system substrate-binding protein